MKTIFILLFTLTIYATGTIKSQDTIPDPGFENWINTSTLQHWETTNIFLPPGVSACYQTQNSYSGSFAAQLKTVNHNGTPVPGLLTLGEVGMGYTTGGVAFVERPQSLSGFIKHPSHGDEIFVFIEFFKNGTTIGSGFWSTTDSLPEFTGFNVPISFQSPENPDTMNITILSDQYIIGSSAVIDQLELQYPVTSIEKNTINPVGIYPNPCRDHLMIESLTEQDLQVSILNLHGESIKETLHTPVSKINTSDLAPGTYIMIIQSGQNTYRKKFIKL